MVQEEMSWKSHLGLNMVTLNAKLQVLNFVLYIVRKH